jgi:hypothetical protein
MPTVRAGLRTLRSRRFRRTDRLAMDMTIGRLASISFKVETTASAQFRGNWGKTLLALITTVFLLLPGLSPAASHNAATDGAKKEGKFVLYTAMQPEDSTKLIELYRSRFPFVDASFFRAGSAPLLNRILTESRAGRFLFDVVSGKVSDLLLLQKRGLLGTISSSELIAYSDTTSITTTTQLLTTANAFGRRKFRLGGTIYSIPGGVTARLRSIRDPMIGTSVC